MGSHASLGEMSERLMVTGLKPVVAKVTGGSNPSLSALCLVFQTAFEYNVVWGCHETPTRIVLHAQNLCIEGQVPYPAPLLVSARGGARRLPKKAPKRFSVNFVINPLKGSNTRKGHSALDLVPTPPDAG